MALFQQSVLKKYIAGLDPEALSAAWKVFHAHFHHPATQANIRQAKEEQYQEGFLRDLFVNVLGYTLNPQPHFNLTTEYKNEKDSKKADGAILKEGAVRAVIELKGTDTTDLAKIEAQAFGYLHNQRGCTYVITSNFEKLRFYIGDATDHIEFNLFGMGRAEFDLLYLCLHAGSLLADVPLQVKAQSVTQEDAITKKLYADYSTSKQALYQNIVALNGGHDKVLLFKKTQKLLDRFLFILFAEDRLLLPPNFIVKIVEEHRQVQKLRMQQSLYERFKIYFTDLLHGNRDEDIFAYNGGLFEPDVLLDGLHIADDVLQQGVLRLSQYDYNTEVDVNILGHIFEHSLNEIEELQASLEQTAVDRTKTRRKREGVFYTPRYITKYIVDNTVGALCAEKKAALQMVEADYAPALKKTRASEAERRALVQKLDDYRAWLLQLTICDPACGSGAFLNAALEALIAEHNYVDELTNKLMGSGTLEFKWTPNDILEHNLFGVDINEEAVEIARLSLWLRTAQRGRKLSNLSNNIKAGNSLIDDPAVAGANAFKWEQEFADVFQKGGFDVVIGNPPYVPLEMISNNEKAYYKSMYNQLERKYDLSIVFILRSLAVLQKEGLLAFISSVTWQTGENYKKFREFIIKHKAIKEVINLPFDVFEDAYVDTCIYIISKQQTDHYRIKNYSKKEVLTSLQGISFEEISIDEVSKSDYKLILNKTTNSIASKIKKANNLIHLGAITVSTQGLSGSRFEKVDGGHDESYFPFLFKGQAYRYFLNVEELRFVDLEGLNPLKTFYEKKQKLLIRRLISRSDRLLIAFTDEKLVFTKDINPFIVHDKRFDTKYLLPVLASKLISYLYLNTSSIATKDDFRQTTLTELRNILIPHIQEVDQQPFIDKADIMLSKNKELHALKQSLLQFLQAKYESILISKKLADWPQLTFKEFLKELEKQKIKLTLAEQAEWLPHFEGEKKKAVALQSLIDQTDQQIDKMVYALYGLTEAEIKIVEGS